MARLNGQVGIYEEKRSAVRLDTFFHNRVCTELKLSLILIS